MFNDHGFYKAALAALFCLSAFYLYDLYNFVVMHDRRELVLRLVQALGLAWVALAVAFYALPQLMLGRGVSLIAMPLALFLMVAWRLSIHWLLGHPNVGERVLIIGTGETAVDLAREILERRDAGYRIVGFVDDRPEMVGQSLINPRVIGLTSQMVEIVKRENVNASSSPWANGGGSFPPSSSSISVCRGK